jgi:hypothetical protein
MLPAITGAKTEQVTLQIADDGPGAGAALIDAENYLCRHGLSKELR